MDRQLIQPFEAGGTNLRRAVERLTRRMPLPRPRRPLGCGPLPNKGWCRNSGKNEIGCGSRYRRRARRSSAHRRAALALWDTSHRNGKPCRYGVGMPHSGTGRPDLVHLWQLLEASRSGTARFVPSISSRPSLANHFGGSPRLLSSRFQQQAFGRANIDIGSRGRTVASIRRGG